MATFEGDGNDGASQYVNVDPSNVVSFTAANHTAGGVKVIRMNQSYKIGPSKSLKVNPGDKVDMEVWEYHEGTSGFGTNTTPLTTLITMVSGAFGGVSGGGGESGLIYSRVNAAINAFVPGGNQGTNRPAAYLNYILFDRNYNLIDMGWQLAPATTFTKQKLSFNTLDIKEPGYLFVYLSYDNDSNNWVYFDDFKVSHTKSNVVQYNEYYPFGLQTSNSWTRENSSNNFLYNAGNELNENSGWYETFFRGYDPTLGRFNQVDPMAYASSSHTPYNYGYDDPVFYNDPLGDEPAPVAKPEGIPIRAGGGNGNPFKSEWYWNMFGQYRSMETNLMLMGMSAFESYYGSDLRTGEGRWDAAQAMAQAPMQNDLNYVNDTFGSNFELNSNGAAGYWDMSMYTGTPGGAHATWVSINAQQGGPGDPSGWNSLLPVAVMLGGDVDLFVAGAGEFGAGGILILRGPDAGKLVGYLDYGVGLGLDLSVAAEGGFLFYTGDASNFTAELLKGGRFEMSGALGPVGLNVFVSDEVLGERVIGVLGSYGPGINPLVLFGIPAPFTFNFNYGATDLFKGKK